MTLYQYMLLDQTDQACVLWNKGVFLCRRKNNQHFIELYQIDGFYVEVVYHRWNNKIERTRSFRSVDQLRPYLDQIDIEKFI